MSKEKKWSSFPEQQKLVENWNKYLMEFFQGPRTDFEPFRAGTKTVLPGAEKAQGGGTDSLGQARRNMYRRKGQGSALGGAKEEYPASGVVEVTNGLFKLAGIMADPEKADLRTAIVDEFENLLNAQNLVIKEIVTHDQAQEMGALAFSAHDRVKFVLGDPRAPMPQTLELLAMLLLENAEAYKKFMHLLVKAGFSVDSIKLADTVVQKHAGKKAEKEAPVSPEGDTDGDGTPDEQDKDADGDGKPDAAQQGEKIVVMWPKVEYHAMQNMGDRYDERKARFVMQALSRVNQNPNIEFVSNLQIGEEMDVSAAAQFLEKVEVDEAFIRDIIKSIIATSGATAADFINLREPEAAKPDAGPPEATTGEPEKAPEEEPEDTDGDGTPDEQDQDDDGDGTPDDQDQDDDGDGVPDAEEPGAEEEEEEELPDASGSNYMVPNPNQFTLLRNAWKEADPPSGTTFQQDLAAFADFIGPYVDIAKESGVLKDVKIDENVIQQLIGRPGGEDKQPWRQSPFLRIGNKGADGKTMQQAFNALPKSKSPLTTRGSIERVITAALGPGGKNSPLNKQFRDMLGAITRAPEEEPAKEPQKAAASQDPPRRRDTRAKQALRRQRDAASPSRNLGRGTFFEEGADALNESKTIERWKTLAGIK